MKWTVGQTIKRISVLLKKDRRRNALKRKNGYYPGIQRDKTMDNKIMCTSNYYIQNNPFCRLKLLVKKVEYCYSVPLK